MACYLFVDDPITYYGARLRCISRYAYVVDIHSSGENDFVRGLVPPSVTGGIHIGYERSTLISNAFNWHRTGNSGSFTNWKTGEPNNHGGQEGCADMDTAAGEGKWNDVTCWARDLPYVCKKSKCFEQITAQVFLVRFTTRKHPLVWMRKVSFQGLKFDH